MVFIQAQTIETSRPDGASGNTAFASNKSSANIRFGCSTLPVRLTASEEREPELRIHLLLMTLAGFLMTSAVRQLIQDGNEFER